MFLNSSPIVFDIVYACVEKAINTLKYVHFAGMGVDERGGPISTRRHLKLPKRMP